MTAVKRDLYIEQGATFVMPFQWCGQGPEVDGAITPGAPKDLTGWTVRMQIRKNQGEPALVTASTTNGKVILGDDPSTEGTVETDPTNGWITVILTDDDTDLLIFRSAKYDLEAENPAGRVFRLLQGAVTVDPNITQETDDPVVGA